MDVIVSRSGGIAGLRLTWRVDVDTQPDPDRWYVLIGEIPWEEAPAAPPEPDRYTYRIRCEPHEGAAHAGADHAGAGHEGDDHEPTSPKPHDDAAAEAREATLAERQLTGPWRELFDRVREAAEPQRGGHAER
jgi:hypothetical protein